MADQSMMKEILDALKELKMNQVQLASNVDAISGRVNVLAGMKEVRDVAAASNGTAVKQNGTTLDETTVEGIVLEESKVPESPSLTPSQLDGGAKQMIHTRTGSSSTSRIILT